MGVSGSEPRYSGYAEWGGGFFGHQVKLRVLPLYLKVSKAVKGIGKIEEAPYSLPKASNFSHVSTSLTPWWEWWMLIVNFVVLGFLFLIFLQRFYA